MCPLWVGSRRLVIADIQPCDRPLSASSGRHKTWSVPFSLLSNQLPALGRLALGSVVVAARISRRWHHRGKRNIRRGRDLSAMGTSR